MGQSFLGPQHEVLAILSGPEEDPARTALEAQGVTHDRLFDLLAGTDSWPPSRPYDGPIGTNPAWHDVMGWAKGFAAARGDRLTSADVLLGAVYSDSSITSTLGLLGVIGEDLVGTLAQNGCPVPAMPPSPMRGVVSSKRAGFAREHLSAVLERLKKSTRPKRRRTGASTTTGATRTLPTCSPTSASTSSASLPTSE